MLSVVQRIAAKIYSSPKSDAELTTKTLRHESARVTLCLSALVVSSGLFQDFFLDDGGAGAPSSSGTSAEAGRTGTFFTPSVSRPFPSISSGGFGFPFHRERAVRPPRPSLSPT